MEYYTTSIVSDWFEYNLSYNLNFKPDELCHIPASLLKKIVHNIAY